MSDSTKIETSTGFYYIEDGIMHIEFKKDADVDLEAAKEGVEARKKLQQGRPMLTFCDTSGAWQITNESREYSSGKEVDGMNIAMAIVTGSSFAAITAANFYMKINKPQTPTKVFNSKKKAIEWLNTFK